MTDEFIVTTESGKHIKVMALDKAHALLTVAELWNNEVPKQASLNDEW
jgi:hypothetical protein